MVKKFSRLMVLFWIMLAISGCNILKSVPLAPTDELQSTENTPPVYQEYKCVRPNQRFQTATVVRVIDGDSIEVRLDGKLFEVRYIGVNTPEYYSKDRPAAIHATQANEALLSDKEVFLFRDVSEIDKYNRLLRYVFTDDAFVNLELVKLGYAESRAYPPDISCQDLFDKNVR